MNYGKLTIIITVMLYVHHFVIDSKNFNQNESQPYTVYIQETNLSINATEIKKRLKEFLFCDHQEMSDVTMNKSQT